MIARKARRSDLTVAITHLLSAADAFMDHPDATYDSFRFRDAKKCDTDGRHLPLATGLLHCLAPPMCTSLDVHKASPGRGRKHTIIAVLIRMLRRRSFDNTQFAAIIMKDGRSYFSHLLFAPHTVQHQNVRLSIY